jgi:tetratricopeptide (TPR) repeat protein
MIPSSTKKRILIAVFGLLIIVAFTLVLARIPQKIIANYFYVQGLEQFQQGRGIQAEAFFSRALSWNPRHLRSAEYLVLIAAPTGNHQEIMRRFQYARELGSSWEPIYSIAASLRLVSGNYQEARDLLEEAIARNERNRSALEKFLSNVKTMEDFAKRFPGN